MWVPAKDTGVDLLVTSKVRRRPAVGLQVKFSRSFRIREEMARHLIATSWFTLDPQKIRKSRADLWVFAILTLKHEEHFVVIPVSELRKRIPPGSGKKWNLYLWVFNDGTCYQVRGLSNEERLTAMHEGVRDRRLDFTEWLERWDLLDKYTKGPR